MPKQIQNPVSGPIKLKGVIDMAQGLKAKPGFSAQLIMLTLHAKRGDFGTAAFIKEKHLRIRIAAKLKGQ